ncbi:hypothetical protein PUN28_010054 [Cardiocondyla obscurior]|uniref:Late nodulin n=1 Tax=Cardiocondyla obscurior TaxID=286306 RepID=A0AAW2FN95_9HYME
MVIIKSNESRISTYLLLIILVCAIKKVENTMCFYNASILFVNKGYEFPCCKKY